MNKTRAELSCSVNLQTTGPAYLTQQPNNIRLLVLHDVTENVEGLTWRETTHEKWAFAVSIHYSLDTGLTHVTASVVTKPNT